MIGLEYVLKLFEMTQQELADKLEIKQQNIDSWIKKKRNIPKKWIPQLSEIFNIPEKYFQRELNYKDREKIQMMKLHNTNDEKELGYTEDEDDWVPDDEYNSFYEKFNQDVLNKYNIIRKELMDNIQKALDLELGASEYYHNDIYLRLIASKSSKIILINKILPIINDCKRDDSEILEKVLNGFNLFLKRELLGKSSRKYDEESIKFICAIKNLIANEKERIIKKEEDSRKEAEQEREIIEKIGLDAYKKQLFEEYEADLLEQYEKHLLKKNIEK